MKINVLILFAVLSIFFISCDKNMKWINPTDSQTDQAEIDKICKDGGYECGDIIATYKDVKIEINCGECSDGYECSNNKCFDIDECKNPDLNNCPEHSTCANKEGTYSCVCDENYTWIDSECVENPQDDADTDDSGDSEQDDDADTADSTDDSGNSEPDDTDTYDSDSAPDNGDSTPDDDADTDSGDSTPDEDADTDTTPTTPCNPNPCSSIENSTGVCSISDSDYLCGCNSGYFWNGSECKKQITLGNICTGQNRCFNETEEIPCPTSSTADFYGQDAQYAKTGYCYPQSFTVKTVSGQNIVVDNNTGLEWQQVISEDIFNWDDAVSHCESLEYAGYTDWRLPSPQEHLTIIDSSKYTPAINKTYFPMPNGDFWSSADHANPENSNTWKVDYNSGFVENVVNSNTLRVLCVRGNELKQSTFTTSTINSDVVVKDSVTGLIWQKIYVTDKTWEEALKYCKDLTYAGKSDWRLPNKNEITTLVNYDKVNPASDFPDIILDSPTSNWFKSSTTTASSLSKNWSLYAPNGAIRENSNKSTANNVRCVRSEKINDPCNPNPCNGVANSTQICTQHNAFEFSCGCNNGYFWDGQKCAVLPECSATSGTPCKDLTSKLTWSPLASNDMTQPNASNYCNNLFLYGFNDWHLPTIDELRTLIKNCPGTETNGACAISEKNGKLSGNDYSDNCSCEHMNNNGGYYSKIGDDDTISPWSSSIRSDDTERAWYVGFFAGKINNSAKSVLSDVRCVRK